jgi:glucose/arabinose dehydrogenase
MKIQASLVRFSLLLFPAFPAAPQAAIPTDVATVAAFETNGKNRMNQPVWFGEVPGKQGCFLVAEHHTGSIFLLSPAAGGYSKQAFLTVAVSANNEQGLLSLAFHPDFAANRKYYVHYCAASGERRLVVEEREMDATLLKDSGKPPRIVIEVPQPAGLAIHNGGVFTFGPDGMAYMSIGEGGQSANAQSRSELLGNILRLKVDPVAVPNGYQVPDDNPFVGQAGVKPEVWAFGLRNPWRMSWDMEGRELWVGDVGQSAWEEVDMVRKGDNLGWNIMEGTHCNNCNADGYAKPIKDIGRADANCIIGGVVFRGDPASAFYGTYLFADHITKYLFALTQANRVTTDFAKVGTLPAQPLSFGRDAMGNVYVSLGNGEIHRLVHSELKPRTGPVRLSPAASRAAWVGSLEKRNGGYAWNTRGETLRNWELLAVDGAKAASGGPSEGVFRVPPGIYFARVRTDAGAHALTLYLD